MTAEVLQHLRPERGGLFVDCTVGLGGHSRAPRNGVTRLIGLDRDRDALHAGETLAPWRDQVELVHADYRSLADVLDGRHLAQSRRRAGRPRRVLDAVRRTGTRLQLPAGRTLDMRMDRTSGETAAQLVARVDEGELADVIFNFGEERFSRRIARRSFASASRRRSIDRPSAAIVRRAVPRRGYSRIDPATRMFQALRIWVNRELDGSTVRRDGPTPAPARAGRHRFHSLEDRIVKHTLPRSSMAARRASGCDQKTACAGRRGSPAQPTGAQRQAAGSGRIA
jgi:16S rRNA (cytosine1402-N4)-methyltransferase